LKNTVRLVRINYAQGRRTLREALIPHEFKGSERNTPNFSQPTAPANTLPETRSDTLSRGRLQSRSILGICRPAIEAVENSCPAANSGSPAAKFNSGNFRKTGSALLRDLHSSVYVDADQLSLDFASQRFARACLDVNARPLALPDLPVRA
jgi:hypothetical protein